jgi:hypothetical protein
VEVAELKAEEKISGHGNLVPKLQSHFDPSKSFSFVDALKNTAPNPSPPLTRGRRSKKDQIAHGVGKNNSLGREAPAPFGSYWQIEGIEEISDNNVLFKCKPL